MTRDVRTYLYKDSFVINMLFIFSVLFCLPSQNSFSYELMLVFGRELSCNKFGSTAYKKVLTMQSTFITLMDELFPWFNVDNISITTPTSETKEGGALPGGGGGAKKEGDKEREKKLEKESAKL